MQISNSIIVLSSLVALLAAIAAGAWLFLCSHPDLSPLSFGVHRSSLR